MNLEDRYRRLLALYPADHRRHYEAEMIGVLMASSRPGQRFPAPGDTVDLVRSAARTRLRHALRFPRTGAWRDAGAVLGLLGAVLLAAVALTRLVGGLRLHFLFDDPMDGFGLRGGLLMEVGLRSVAWSAVVAAVLFGARRTAAGLALVATTVEVGILVQWSPVDPGRVAGMAWLPVLTALVVGALVLARNGRTARAVLGRRLAPALAGVFLVAVAGHHSAVGFLPWGLGERIAIDGSGPAMLPPPVTMAAALPVVWAVWQLKRPVRRRLVALAVPVGVMPAVADAAESGYGVPLGVPQVALLVAVPAATLFWGVVAVRRRERRSA